MNVHSHFTLKLPGHIRDEETDLWLEGLKFRDAAKKDMTEEDIWKIHRGIGFALAALEKRVKALEELQQGVERKQAQMQATGTLYKKTEL